MNKLLAIAAAFGTSLSAAAFSVCAVGDSITQGGSSFTAHRFALEEAFAEAGWGVQWKGSVTQDASGRATNPCEGYSGKNAQQIASNYADKADNPDYDLAADVLLLHAGHNYNADPSISSPAYKPAEEIVALATNAHAQIIAKAREHNPNVIVLYAKVITSGGTEAGTGREVKYSYITNGLNQAIGVLGAQLDTPDSPVVVVDMADGWNYRTDCVADHVHPTDAGAAKMAKKWMAAIRSLVGDGKLSVGDLVVTKDMTLTEDAAYDSVTVADTATLNLNGHRLDAGTISGNGTILSVTSDPELSQAGYEPLSYVATPADNADVYGTSVDTGYTPLLTDRVETKVRLGDLGSANQGIFSARATAATNTFTCVLSNGDGNRKLRFDHHTTSPYTFHKAEGASANTEYAEGGEYEIVMDGGTLAFSVNGEVSSTALTANPADPAATPGMTFRLFVVATKGSGATLPAKDCRMYYFRVYDKDGALKLDLVPAMRRSDGKAGFYDKVGKSFRAADALLAGPAQFQPQDLTVPGGTCATRPAPYKGAVANLFSDNFTYVTDDTHRLLFKKASLPFAVDYDFGEGGAVAVNMYRIHGGYKLRSPKKWKLLGSNDPAAFDAETDDLWTELDSRDSQADWTHGSSVNVRAECRTRFFDNDTPYRYYRLKVEKQQDETHDYAELVQLEYFRVETAGGCPGELHLASDFDLENTTVALGGDMRVLLDGSPVDPVPALPVVDACLVEAEAFSKKGGWVVDPQFVEQMGSPYLLAHGKGIPVANATTYVNMRPGSVRAWVRTRDWTPDWDGEKPGRFELILGGRKFPVTLGVAPATWGWVDAGVVEVGEGPQVLALQDLTGFEGRCDAIYLCPASTATPPNDLAELAAWRAAMRGEAEAPDDVVEADFVVVGGGMAGTAAGIAAADAGMNVVIVQDRPVLGGNASDEIRVLSCRKNDEYHWIVKAIQNGNKDNGYVSSQYDKKRMDLAGSYPNLALHLGWRAYGVVTNAERKIVAVDARNVETGARRRFVAPLYCDATGDGWIAYWAGAGYMLGREGKGEYNELYYAPNKGDKSTMGNSVLWTTKIQAEDYVFPDVPWAKTVSKTHSATNGNWHWEAGLDPSEDTIDDAEMLRDRLFRAIYGSFSTAKANSANAKCVFDWVGYIAGKRESRRIVGDYVVSESDVLERRKFEDAIGIATWGLDLHKQRAGWGFIADNDNYSVSPWWMPYRALCCRDVPNLFLAGRCASFTHIAFASCRVQHACGQQGVAVGYAASLCKKYGCLPRGIYQDAAKMSELQKRMNAGQSAHGMSGYSWPALQPFELEHMSLVVDNDDPAGVEISGTWKKSTYSLARYGASYLHNDSKASESLWVRFTPDIPSNATYSVYLFWNGETSRASAVPVEIVYDGGTVTNSVDMTKRSSSWNKIGAWPFAKGKSGSVRIMTIGKADKVVIADAVKFAIAETLQPSDDTDRNGLPDAWEREHFLQRLGTDPDADPDGDGQSNRCEYVVGSDPNVVNRPFAVDSIESAGADTVSLAWEGVAGRVYQLKRATDPRGPYEDYGSPVAAAADGRCALEVPTGDAASAFFKIDVSLP